MENDSGPFPSSGLDHMPIDYHETQMPNSTLSNTSYLDLHDIYIPTFLEELPDLDTQNDQAHHQTHSNSSLTTLPTSENTYSSLLHLSEVEFDPDMFQSLFSDACVTADSAIDSGDGDRCVDYSEWLVEPTESYESFTTDPVTGSASCETPEICDLEFTPGTYYAHENYEEEESDQERRGSSCSSKNLMSERNRRKRLSQQLLALRALVPNITKMDKRSVLADALSYLSGIHEEIERVRSMLREKSHNVHNNPNNTITPNYTSKRQYSSPQLRIPKSKSQILEIDVEKIEDHRFIVKITSEGGDGVGGQVLRVIESLGFEITYAALDKISPMLILTTVFIRVRKTGKMTEEKLKNYITSKAIQAGIVLKNP